MLDFQRIKEVKLTDVLARYKIPLRFKGPYAAALCPLPSHKPGDTAKSFSVNLQGNFWRCFSESCNANNGGKRGGDCINFVAAMENCSQRDAAEKLAGWYGVGQKETAPHMEKPSKEKPKTEMQSSNQNPSISSDSVKYMASIEVWFNEAYPRREGEDDEAWKKRFLNSLKGQLILSYKAGQKSKAA